MPNPPLRCARRSAWYWLMQVRYSEAIDWIDRALVLPGADAHPALRVKVLCIKSWALWPLGRNAERLVVTAEAEELAKAVGDAGLLSQVLESRSVHESAHLSRFDVAETLADEALSWANAARDDWWVAKAEYARVLAAQGAEELRERVDRTAPLLERWGDVHDVAEMYGAAAYAALCHGALDDAGEFLARAVPLAERLDSPFLQMLLHGNSGSTRC